ncbi:MAG: SDR family oxidoreductase [Nonlabens sp.]|nr:SDR family oxidoreductase [Nonlabens sp.]
MKEQNRKVLVTGGAGFIGSNLCEYLVTNDFKVVALDNLATGHKHNLDAIAAHPNFQFMEGDIRDIDTCRKAVAGCDFVLHQAALGSVPRSIKDPITSNDVNVGGFLNMLVASRDAGVKKMVYAASSSTYGDSKALPKIEENIGKPLSPYAITKFVNELYADVFYKTYGFNTIGLRYFNVFGRKQDPNGAYAAVIPLFTKQLMRKESPTINGDGTYSRDFTYIDNVIQANVKAMLSTNPEAENTVFNVAYGDRTDLNMLISLLKESLSTYDNEVAQVETIYGPLRAGDVPHSLASIDKAKSILGYNPQFNLKAGLDEAVKWYRDNL